MTWPAVKLAEVARIDRIGIDPKKIDSDTQYLGLEHIESGGEILGAQTVSSGDLASTKFQFDTGHFLYGKLRPYLAKIALPNFSGICSTDILPIRSGQKIDRRFLAHFLRMPNNVALAASRSTGVNLPRLSPKALADFDVPLPPLADQRRIAAILDKADRIRKKRAHALVLAEIFLRSTYVHTVGHLNPEFDSWNPSSIEQLAAGHRNAIRSGPFGSALRHGEFVDEGIAVLGIDNAVQNKFAWDERRFITEEKYDELRRYKVFPRDVIVTIMGTTGRSAVVPEDIPEAITTKHLATITCNTDLILPEVLSFAIHSDPMIVRQIDTHNKGAIMDGLNLGIIRNLILKRPPMKEQIRFTEILTRTRALQEQSNSPGMDGSDLFFALSQRAFRGEV